MRKLIVPFLASIALGCAPAAKVVTAPVNAAAGVASATTGAAAGVATTATGAAAGVASATVGTAANVATAPVAAVAGAPAASGLSVKTTTTTRPAVGGACEQDAAKFCPGVTTGVGKCLAQHRSEVSAPCGAVMTSLAKFPNCLEDTSRLCPTTTPSGAGFMACLRTRQNDLSEECRQQMRKVR